jgi:hypothetical protein
VGGWGTATRTGDAEELSETVAELDGVTELLGVSLAVAVNEEDVDVEAPTDGVKVTVAEVLHKEQRAPSHAAAARHTITHTSHVVVRCRPCSPPKVRRNPFFPYT